jgi:hypothetical protein
MAPRLKRVEGSQQREPAAPESRMMTNRANHVHSLSRNALQAFSGVKYNCRKQSLDQRGITGVVLDAA